jgi:hypothetical protein
MITQAGYARSAGPTSTVQNGTMLINLLRLCAGPVLFCLARFARYPVQVLPLLLLLTAGGLIAPIN